MAATGGGKIRSRRSHIASKPYAKNKQQQTGLISRVTDTVKSIVPSWLQRYFNNGGSPGAVQGTEPNCQTTLPPNGSEEGPPPLDGRDSPEPSTSNAEPSTSRASLNFQEYVLSRPPLSRSHLHFPPLDASSPALGASSSLFSQPSTSSAPGPFSTGFSLVKEIKDNLSQHEDDNISTTSGFSSRASDKDVPNSKTASLPQLWSPETDRTNSGPQPSQSTLKKPAFNLSVFGNSSNSTLNSTILNSSQLGDSPFYPGKTMYGGAAAVKSSRARPGTPYQAPVRRQIKAKPAGAQPCGVTSATARRILQSLERMSSPLADAKRIPSASSSPMSASLDGTNLDMSPFQAKKKRMEHLPPVQKLVVPSALSASSNRSVSFRPSLTPGVRTPRDTPTRQSPLIPEATPGPSLSTIGSGGQGYPVFSTPVVSAAGSGGGKMKRERSTARPSTKRPDDDEVPEAPDLPAISLPISSTALPTFSFSSPVPPLTSATSSPAPNTLTTTPVKTTTINKVPAVASSPPSVPFTFSSPIVKATAASPPSFSPTAAGFTFSAPVAKLGSSMTNCKAGTSTMATVKPMANKSTEEFEGPFKPAKTLKQGSVLDLLKDPGFSSPVTKASDSEATPSQATAPYSSSSSTTTSSSSSSGLLNPFKPLPGWSCDVCLVQNKSSDTKCVCCSAPQPNSSKSSESKTSAPPSIGLDLMTSTTASTSTTSTTSGFGAMFSKPSGTWDCDTCLVQNKPEAVKCVACETAKPGTGLKSSLTLPSAFSAVKTVAPPTDPFSTVTTVGLGDKFKAPEGSWECDACMVQNKAGDTKCVACTSPKPGASDAATTAPSVASSSTAAPSSSSTPPTFGFGDKFKTPEGDWECEVCLVSNQATDVQCVACTTAKPGAKVEPKAFGTTFGSSTNGTSSSSTFAAGGFKFGTTDSTAPSSGSGGFKFGGSFPDASASSTTSGGFKFGTAFGSSSSETTSKDTTTAPSSGFKFGASSEGFKFGTASSDDKKSEQPATNSGFKFGTSGGINFGTGSTSTESNSTNGGFTFGQSKPEEKSTESNSTSSTVTFSASSQEKSDSPAPSSTNISTSSTTTASIFGSLASSTTPGGATFGTLTSEKDTNAAPTFTFGKPEEKKEATPSAQSSFMFGAANKDTTAAAPASTGGFSFSTPTTAAPSSDQPTFTFGKPADKSDTTTTEPPKPVFSFGQSAADSAAASKPAFSFMASTNPSTNSNTSNTTSTPVPSLFGSSSSTTPDPAAAPSPVPSTFVFGQPASSSSSSSADPPQTKAFMFGASQDSQPAAPSGPAPASAQPFIFGASATAAPPAPAAAAPSFNFGATAPPAASSAAPSAAPAPFSFSSASSGGFGTNQTPSFGSSFGSPFPAQSSQPPAFGAKPNAAPAFGQTNSTPVFGAAANSTPAGGGFPFGGASAFGASNSGTGVFAFGAGSASPAPSAAPPIAPQPGAAPGGFNFSQGNFNIGSNKSFSSSPGGQPIAGRRIKTAVRRRK